MSIIADTDSSDGTAKKGDQLWVVDTKPMLLTAVANLEVSAATGASYQPTRRGDRLLVEFIAGGATAVPRIEKGWPIIKWRGSSRSEFLWNQSAGLCVKALELAVRAPHLCLDSFAALAAAPLPKPPYHGCTGG